MDQILGARLIDLRSRICEGFDANNWEELGLLTGASELITGHPRLLRSLSFGDEDYSSHVLTVLRRLVEQAPQALPIIEGYVGRRLSGDGAYISAKPSQRCITFAPYVFHVPEAYPEVDLVAVMMPFSKEFDGTYEAIKQAALESGLRCLRADDIWDEATVVQDIFNLIFRSHVVIVDFTGKNPNVMYETGIAHTLGKHVIPLSQSLDDVPFDMRHHRVLKYLSNNEGLQRMASELAAKLKQFNIAPAAEVPVVEAPDDDIPF